MVGGGDEEAVFDLYMGTAHCAVLEGWRITQTRDRRQWKFIYRRWFWLGLLPYLAAHLGCGEGIDWVLTLTERYTCRSTCVVFDMMTNTQHLMYKQEADLADIEEENFLFPTLVVMTKLRYHIYKNEVVWAHIPCLSGIINAGCPPCH